ncbi:MAG TPA: serine hydrolase domain-containing protein, partial [Gemmatimonadaceae bacterium]|nr:serine hydrolase domain-containing protein [Gemmatimonadaceae bacterium]
MKTTVLSFAVILLPAAAAAQLPDSARIAAAADRVLAPHVAQTRAAPGCAVGIAQSGRQVYAKAFGLADMEFNVPNTPETIFESGSVAKQFTAASIVTLAIDGKLRIDDPVRKYIPELPDYGAPLTIRHLLNHTSGIRDWGSVLELTGFGRGDRVISQKLALDVIVHQRGVDFTPGAEYSYSNSGYTLLSTIVERVSKQSLPAFTAEH